MFAMKPARAVPDQHEQDEELPTRGASPARPDLIASAPRVAPTSRTWPMVTGASREPVRRTSERCWPRPWGPPEPPISMLALPPQIALRMTGADRILSSRMIANRFSTFSVVTSQKIFAPRGLNSSRTCGWLDLIPGHEGVVHVVRR
jgi:hypothetical protein